jgi:hypothetical protein
VVYPGLAAWGGFGAAEVRPVFTTCPHCSYLVNGTCVVCQEGDEHPSCAYCVDGKYYPPPEPWYKSQLTVAIITAIVVAVTSSIVVGQIEGAIKRRRK